MNETVALQSLATWFRMIMSDSRFILLLLQMVLAWFVGSTFKTSSYLLVGVGIASVLVLLRTSQRQPIKPESTSGTSQPYLLEPNDGDVRPWPWWRVLLAYLVGIVVVLLVVFLTAWLRREKFLGPSGNLLQAWVDAVGHAAVVLSLMAWCVWPRRGHPFMLMFGFAAILVSIAGGGISTNLTGQTAGGLAVCIGFCIASQTILRRPGLTIHTATVTPMVPGGDTKGFLSLPYQLLALSVFLIAASALTRVTSRLLPDLQAGVFAELREVIDASTIGLRLGTGNYVTGSKLGEIREHLVVDPNAIALRVHCSTVPGYLKGRAFDNYRRSRWHAERVWEFGTSSRGSKVVAITSTGPAKSTLYRPGNRTQRRFDLFEATSEMSAEATAKIKLVEVHNEPHRGAIVFIPATMHWVEAAATRLDVTPHGILAGGLDLTQPYVLGAGEQAPEDPLTFAERELMTNVDRSIRAPIALIASEVCGSASTATEKANRIANHFQRKFSYSLETVDVPPGTDPIIHFLRTGHPGHCELFATATALMLRTQDVPTRYLTGYVADLMDDDGAFYIAKNRDAHAWVEYYDESTRRWFPVESTPGRSYHTVAFEQEDELQANGNVAAVQDESNQSSWWSEFIGWFLSLRSSDTINTLFQWIQLPLLLALTGWLIWHSRETEPDRSQWQVRRAQRRWDRKMRRHGLIRRCGETLHQFADRIELATQHSRDNQKLLQAATWYREHARIRYRGI